MRTILLAGLVLGCATLVNGQEGVRKVIFKSDTQQRVGRTVQARGHVRIFHGTAEVTADEADLTDSGSAGPIDIQLRGNVHMHVNIAN